MSAWRRIAIEKFPAHRPLVERSESVGMLWTDLWYIFVRAHHEPQDDETIRRVYEFARWCCVASNSADVATSAVCHFYEHLPTSDPVRRDLPKHMTTQEFQEVSEAFKYHLPADEFDSFAREFYERRQQIGQAIFGGASEQKSKGNSR
jgi:hypothetical protein